MKTPLEAIDETISRLKSLRSRVEGIDHWTWGGQTTGPNLHFHRDPEDAGQVEESRLLARHLGDGWTKDTSGCWQATICGIAIFIHNAEPARNPQPEAVEL